MKESISFPDHHRRNQAEPRLHCKSQFTTRPELNSLQSQVKGFNAQISKNTKGIASNATKIKSTVKDVNEAKKRKAKELNKAGGGL